MLSAAVDNGIRKQMTTLIAKMANKQFKILLVFLLVGNFVRQTRLLVEYLKWLTLAANGRSCDNANRKYTLIKV